MFLKFQETSLGLPQSFFSFLREHQKITVAACFFVLAAYYTGGLPIVLGCAGLAILAMRTVLAFTNKKPMELPLTDQPGPITRISFLPTDPSAAKGVNLPPMDPEPEKLNSFICDNAFTNKKPMELPLTDQPGPITRISFLPTDPSTAKGVNLPPMDPEPEKLNSFICDNISQVIELLKKQPTNDFNYPEELSKALSKMHIIKLSDLKLCLKKCTEELKKKLGDHKYVVSATGGKSSRWIFDYALLFLEEKKRPEFYIKQFTDKPAKRKWSGEREAKIEHLVEEGIRDLVLCDDVAYTGEQLAMIISNIAEKMRSKPTFQLNFYVVCPFISSVAEKRYKELLLPQNLSLHLISTNYKVPMLIDVVSKDSCLFKYVKDNISLTITEWKVPDTISFPYFGRQYPPFNPAYSSPGVPLLEDFLPRLPNNSAVSDSDRYLDLIVEAEQPIYKKKPPSYTFAPN